jgi:hypothetical protein
VIRITYLHETDPRTGERPSYVARQRSDCRGADVHAWDMVEITGRTVTMGKVLAERIA